MARYRDCIVLIARLDYVGQGEVNVAEVELFFKWWSYPENQYMTILGFYFSTFENAEIEFFSEIGVIGFIVKLPMFCQDESVDRDVFRLNPLTIVLNLCSAIVRLY